MAITKPPVLPAWAETGDKVQPTNAELQAGWPLSAIPPSRQRFNWILNFCANAVRYFSRRSIADYDAAETYMAGDRIIGDDGKTYVSLLDNNTANTPSTSPTKWERWGFTPTQLNAAGVFTTQAQFDSSTKPCTTAFAQSVGLRAPIVSVVATGTLPSSAGGALVIVTSATAAVQTLPLAAAVPAGTKIEVLCAYANATIQRQGADNIQQGQSYISSLVLSMNDTAVFESTGANWVLVGGSALLRYSTGDFGASIATSGYQKLPSGLIIQWGSASTAANGAGTITFPIAFPTVCHHISGSYGGAAAAADYVCSFSAITTTGANCFFAQNNSGQATSGGVGWIAIGK